MIECPIRDSIKTFTAENFSIWKLFTPEIYRLKPPRLIHFTLLSIQSIIVRDHDLGKDSIPSYVWPKILNENSKGALIYALIDI